MALTKTPYFPNAPLDALDRYLANRHRPVAAPVAPVAPVVVAKPTVPVSGGYPGYAPPTTDYWGNASARVHGLYDPILNRLSARQASDIEAAKSGAKQWLADIEGIFAKSAPVIDANYNTAIGNETNISDAISRHLKGTESADIGDLAKKLQAINSPTNTDQLSTEAAGANAADYASGMSDVQALVRRKAEAQTFLQNERTAAGAQPGKELLKTINTLAKQYGVQTQDILDKMPSEIQGLVDNLRKEGIDTYNTKYGAEVDKWKNEQASKLDVRDFNYKKQQDLLAQRAAEKKLALETKLTMQNTMNTDAYRRWAKKFDADQRELDRQSREQIAQMSREASAANAGSMTGPPSQRYITGPGGNVYENPNYVPPKAAGSTQATIRLRRNRATSKLDDLFINPDTMAPRERWKPQDTPAGRVKQAVDAVKLIDLTLTKAGIKDPTTRATLRKTYLDQLGIKHGPKGYPIGQEKKK